MKKSSYIIIGLSVICMLVSCSSNKSYNSDEFNTDDAEKIIGNYMDAIESNNLDEAKTFLDKEVLDKLEYPKKSELKTSGWNIEDSALSGSSAIFKVKTSSFSDQKPYSLLEEVTIKIKKEDDEYKIIDVGVNNVKETFMDKDEIRIREKDNVKTQLLIDLEKMPSYMYYKDDVAKFNKLDIPRKSFDIISLAFSGNKMALSSRDKASYVGVVAIEDSVATQGQDEGQGKQGDAKPKTTPKEIPAGKKILNVDLIDNVKVKEMAFCKREKFLAVQYEGNEKFLKCYNAESGEEVSKELEEKFPKSQYDVIFSKFKMDKLIFSVKSKQGGDEKDGSYEMELEDFEIEKL